VLKHYYFRRGEGAYGPFLGWVLNGFGVILGARPIVYSQSQMIQYGMYVKVILTQALCLLSTPCVHWGGLSSCGGWFG
jgi:hypothetical protein